MTVEDKIQSGDLVKMNQKLKDELISNDCKEHVDEFGECVGIVEDEVNYNSDGENDPDKIGPEYNVRWYPSKLRYGYRLDQLDKIKVL